MERGGGGFKNLYEEAISRCSSVLSGDLFVEILQRIPVKSLVRFESISKSWQFVIRSSEFIEKHLIYHQKHEKVKYLHLYDHVPDCVDDFQPFTLCYCPPGDFAWPTTQGIALISTRDDGSIITDALCHSPAQGLSIVDSSNGLVCIKFCYDIFRWNFMLWDRCFAICNPATRKLKHLPIAPPAPYSKLLYLSNRIFGFSYIPRTRSYKLVQILVSKSYEQPNVTRYSSCVDVLNIGADSWREVVCQGQDEAIRDLLWEDLPCEPTKGFTDDNPVIANGCLHWWGRLRTGGGLMVSFDMDKEVFTRTAIPYSNHFDYLKLAVFRDNLALFVSLGSRRDDEEERCFEAWIYDETSRSWAKGFTIGPLPGNEIPVGFWGDGDIIIKSRNEFCNADFEPYVESLLSF